MVTMEKIIAFIFQNQLLVLIIVALLLLTIAEAGFHRGMKLFVAHDEKRKAQISGVHGAVLGMLGLLLGFTFSMAVSRYENRRDLVLQEANAIGTTYLRASFLPEPHRAEVSDLLRRYVDLRLDFHNAGNDRAKIASAEAAAAGVHRALWGHAVAAAGKAPTPITATFINALNEMIDLDATRLNAQRAKVPAAVWLLVLVVAGASCYACGYSAGACGARTGLSNAMLPLLIAVVITLISDFDRPSQGMVLISQQPFIDLKSGFANPPQSE